MNSHRSLHAAFLMSDVIIQYDSSLGHYRRPVSRSLPPPSCLAHYRRGIGGVQLLGTSNGGGPSLFSAFVRLVGNKHE